MTPQGRKLGSKYLWGPETVLSTQHPVLLRAQDLEHVSTIEVDIGALGKTRTSNLLIRSQMLYPLSYERW